MKVVGYDPVAEEAYRKDVPGVEIASDSASAFALSDLWFVHNDGPQWRELTAGNSSGMRRKVVVDGRRIPDREAVGASS